jgi:2-C-methyl-D-erythritol 4-phosphate cytidylyltransferase
MIANHLPVWAVVPATGVGARMQADRPKQYLLLGGRSIIELTLERLLSHPLIAGVVVVLSPQDGYWSQLEVTSDKPVLTCDGGSERFHSVFNGLECLFSHIGCDALVLIHDAVRPFVTHADLDRVIEAAGQGDEGAILALPVADTLKMSDSTRRIVDTRSRQGLWRAFTPQVFRLQLIMPAIARVIREGLEVTDDASAMEATGYRPRLVACDHRNIKITHPEDLDFARVLMASFEQK